MSTFQIGHVALNVSNLERSVAFYADVFGLEVRGRSTEDNRKFAFLGNERGVVLTLWEQSEGAFQPASPGLHHLAIQASSIDEVEAFERKLNGLGAKFLYGGIVTHREGSPSGGIYFEDPDGIRLEIFSPTGAAERGHAVEGGGPSCGFF
ncbi:VOC family protein [Paenibacillus sp.]|uniref:VOC family protein n=1 Tax=Paenibacillus sp. TaxID=58172 RepID=UPI002D3B4DA7|nr:VOC family protein [Paenibacillus sp.]HZG86531.1 VOC family protein [Paenibacillus sp.]